MYAGFVKSKNIEPIPAASPPGVAPRSIPDNRHITFPICSRVLPIAVGIGICKNADAHRLPLP